MRGPARLGPLADVAVLSPTDAWTVGLHHSHGFIEHWDGRRWSRNGISGVGDLQAVAGISSRDVWTVGGEESYVSLHWDGNRWRRVTLASPAQSAPPLSSLGSSSTRPSESVWDVAAISHRDGWAVGGNDGLLTVHWNGHRWKAHLGPNVGDQLSWLISVAALSASDVWAVGVAVNGLSLHEPVVYRWNGKKWRSAAVPPIDGELDGIVARSPTEIWTVGWDDPVLGGRGGTISRWNGRKWRAKEVGAATKLVAIAADKRTHVWAVGSIGNPTDENELGAPTPVILRYGC